MFIKTLKYDFLFSKAAFLAMAGGLIALTVILRITGLIENHDSGSDITGIAGLIFMMALLVVGLAAILQLLQFYYKNFFDDTGYLMLTLPVKRFTLLVSKVVVSIVWFNFMLITAGIVAAIIAYIGPSFMGMLAALNRRNIMTVVEINIVALFFIMLLFFVVTLAHSTIGRWNVHIFISAAAGFLYTGLFFWLHVTLGRRHREWASAEREWLTTIYNEAGEYVGTQVSYSTHYFYQAIVGISVGRIPLGDRGDYFDIYRWGISLVLCVLAFFVTYYLLKRRVGLR